MFPWAVGSGIFIVRGHHDATQASAATTHLYVGNDHSELHQYNFLLLWVEIPKHLLELSEATRL